MKKDVKNFFVYFAMLSLIALGTACESEKADDGGGKAVTLQASKESSGGQVHQAGGGADAQMQDAPKTASVHEALKAAAARQGIFFGEVPEEFPVDFLPLYPGGNIDKSSIKEGEATLLQVVPASKDKVLAHYRAFYKGLGWTTNDPITVAGRTMVGFSGKGAQVDMTMIDKEGGKTFVALALH